MSTSWVSSHAIANWRQALLQRDQRADMHELVAEIDSLLVRDASRVELKTYVDLLERIGSASYDGTLGWAIGSSAPYAPDSDLGKAILGCKTLGAALHWLAYFLPLHQDATALKLEVSEDWSTLSYKILDPRIWPRHQDALYSLGTCAKLIRDASPGAWSHAEVTVEVEAGTLPSELSHVVKTNVVYGGNVNSLRFPTHVLAAPLGLAPHRGGDVIKRLTRELTRKQRRMDIGERCRLMIFTEMNDGCVSQEHIARQLGISSRTLRRKLSAEALSFQHLLDECRMEFAAHEFRTRSKLSLSDMALRLGYSEHSTFSRAFARWAGMAPQEYRRGLAY